jgi:hypothetical protein
MAQNVLTERDRKIIASHTREGPEERYPEVPIYAFKGRHAFDLHSKLVRLIDEWEGLFTEAQKHNCALLVTIQTTVSKATLKNPTVAPINPVRKIHLYFYSKEQMVPSGTSYSSAQGKEWLKLLDEEPGNLL